MFKHFALSIGIVALTGCGGGAPKERPSQRLITPAPVAFGPISKACIESDRKKASTQLCSCIQAVADKTLSRSDQRRSVAFYSDPHLAQEVRQSERERDEEFWDDYAAYAREAERACG